MGQYENEASWKEIGCLSTVSSQNIFLTSLLAVVGFTRLGFISSFYIQSKNSNVFLVATIFKGKNNSFVNGIECMPCNV